ncbi:hypothetical protein RUR49_06800 [Pseudoxanthobacter sp. M-2]|uniref:hypothetical protein n=1 Tax=Pseudoxanthobacter sp. M-2 TaxID=3078754 RepID=UPI0038FCCAE0
MERDASRRISGAELLAWADLVAAFHDRNGRDASEWETDLLIATAREMASTVAPTTRLQ